MATPGAAGLRGAAARRASAASSPAASRWMSQAFALYWVLHAARVTLRDHRIDRLGARRFPPRRARFPPGDSTPAAWNRPPQPVLRSLTPRLHTPPSSAPQTTPTRVPFPFLRRAATPTSRAACARARRCFGAPPGSGSRGQGTFPCGWVGRREWGGALGVGRGVGGLGVGLGPWPRWDGRVGAWRVGRGFQVSAAVLFSYHEASW